jgi:hypothetical protein
VSIIEHATGHVIVVSVDLFYFLRLGYNMRDIRDHAQGNTLDEPRYVLVELGGSLESSACSS